jgi:hypothetical protein
LACVTVDAIQHTPYVVGTADQRVLAAKGQTIYARGQGLIDGHFRIVAIS